jgi:phage FluMu protein Com
MEVRRMNVVTGKCPKCERVMNNLVVETPEIHANFRPLYKGTALLCPHCKTVLSAAIDPIAIKADILRELSTLKKR